MKLPLHLTINGTDVEVGYVDIPDGILAGRSDAVGAMNARQAGVFLGVSEGTVYREVEAGRLVGRKIRGRRVFDVAELRAYLQRDAPTVTPFSARRRKLP